MTTPLILLFCFILIQRFAELILAQRNRKWMMERGAYEEGETHYKWFIIVHGLFFFSLLVEAWVTPTVTTAATILFFLAFVLLQAFRVWCIASLGRCWNTRIIILPNHPIVSKGPYKYIKHPNYWLVLLEFIVIPLLFGAYMTAVLFPVLHLILMKIRIPAEEKALENAQNV
ncbi:isoprenylcysteine carboxyl methyltransferase family protein [Thalassobacillus hwangdonensis]|uniref:Isoprenylcysteine carboxyl methyltransferase family protein n=1 Tax=Thalassobacillus hwangdonensis TaxID=546108 RepID=A0ABW3L058_9BACI